MQLRGMAVLAFKIFGLFFVVRGSLNVISGLESAFGSGSDMWGRPVLDWYLLSGLTTIGIGAFIWQRADRLATRAGADLPEAAAELDAPPARKPETLGPSAAIAIQNVAFTILGVYFLANALIHLSLAVGLKLQDPAGRPFIYPTLLSGFGGTNAITAIGFLLAGLAVLLLAPRLGRRLAIAVWRGGGLVQARRIELLDPGNVVRAQLSVEESDERVEDVALTLFDAEERPRLRLATEGGEAPGLWLSASSGAAMERIPLGTAPAGAQPQSEP